MARRAIHLELARSADHPKGDAGHGYDIVAPLTPDDVLDEDAWRADKGKSRVRRFSAGEDDDEPVFELETHASRPGEDVSITDHDGETRTVRVRSVRPL